MNPRSTVHHRACHHAPRTHRLGCRRGSGATCYMLTVPVREAAVHQMWTPGEAWVTALADCPRICFPFRSSWAEARAQTAAGCPGRARWSSDSDAFTSGGTAPAVLRTDRCCTGSHRVPTPAAKCRYTFVRFDAFTVKVRESCGPAPGWSGRPGWRFRDRSGAAVPFISAPTAAAASIVGIHRRRMERKGTPPPTTDFDRHRLPGMTSTFGGSGTGVWRTGRRRRIPAPRR